MFEKKKRKKKSESKNAKVLKSNNWRRNLSSHCAVCLTGILRFIKEQEDSGLLSSLGIKILILSKLSIAGNILF